MPYDEHFYIPKDRIIRKYIKDKDWYKGKVWTDVPQNNIVHFYWFNIDGRRVERFDTNDFYFTREIQLAIPIKNKKQLHGTLFFVGVKTKKRVPMLDKKFYKD